MTARPCRPRARDALRQHDVGADQVDRDVEAAPVGELAAAGPAVPSSVGSSATSAPSASARSRALGSGSSAITGEAPTSRAIWTACTPSPPMPHSPIDSPGRSPARSVRAAYGVETASASTAACSNGRSSGIEVKVGPGTTTYCAQAPS